jgi:hypothetical protein
MRDIEWDVLQDRDGAIPHRLRVPIDGPQLHGQAIGGPLEPALDGMLGAVLKTYREARNGGGRELLVQRWPSMRRLMDHVEARWDPRNEGILRGPQPMTYDIALTEPNTFIGSLWIAGLRAMARVAGILGRDPEAARYAGMADTSSRAYDEALWNGRYYGRAFDEDTSGLGSGCLADQLNGQWWAHQLELGHVLPTDHVRTALRTIVACNLRHGFRDLEHGFRVFADGDESGLLICTWPDGGRPEPPVRYADEVWTGVEYAVASLCLFEGLEDEAMALLGAVRARYDGTRRNPYNEIECGDHYSRAMAGWSVLQAWTGSSADVVEGTIRLGRREGRAPLLAGTAWARTAVGPRLARVEVVDGAFELRRLVCDAMPSDGSARATLRIDERPVSVDQSWDIGGVAPERPVSLVAGTVVELAW